MSTTDLQDVSKTLRGDQARAGAATHQDGVQSERGANLDVRHIRTVNSGGIERLEDAVCRLVIVCRRLEGPGDSRLLIKDNDVREGAADIDADSLHNVS